MMMVDTGATHSFCSEKIAEKLMFKVEKHLTQMKAVNTQSRVVKGKMQVQDRIGQWEGLIDFLVFPMDDFRIAC